MDDSVSSDDVSPDELEGTGGSVGSEPWKPSKEQELQINVATVLKKKLRSKADIDMEISARALAQKQPLIPIPPVPSAQAILKPYNDGGMGKSVTAFGAAAMAVVFLVRMKRMATGRTQHQRNQERLEYIQKVRERKNEVLSHQIAGATVRSMHLHIRKQRNGLSGLMSVAIKESNARTRDARIGKGATARERKPLMQHTEDRLFDRSEFRRPPPSRGSTGGGSFESNAFSGTFGGANQFTELSQFLFERDAASGGTMESDPSRLQSPNGPQPAGSDANNPLSRSTTRGRSRGLAQSQQQPTHRPLDVPIVNKNLFVMHHRWRDEPFKDTYVETEKVYQYGGQTSTSDLYAFTRTALPNLHLEVHRLKAQLDPEPWDGTRADHHHRAAMRQRDEERRKRAEAAATRKAAKAGGRTGTTGSSRPTVPQSPATARDARSTRSQTRASAPQPPSTARPDTFATSRGSTASLLPPITAGGGGGRGGASDEMLTPRPPTCGSPVAGTPRSVRGDDSAELPALFPSTAGSPRETFAYTEPALDGASTVATPRMNPRPPVPPSTTVAGSPAAEELRLEQERKAFRQAEAARRCAALDADARAQRRQELALLEQVMEEEHRVAIDTFHRFLLHKEMEHSTFTSRSIDEVRRLIESNSLIFPMKRKEILRGPDRRLERRAVGRAMDRELVSPRLEASRKGAASHDAFRDLREAELHVKELVRKHQHEQSVQYTQRWFNTLKASVEAHMGGLTDSVAYVFDLFEPLFRDRITSPKPFHAALARIDDQMLLGGDVQFVLHRLAVPFRVKHSEIRAHLTSKGIALLLLDTSFYRALRDRGEMDEREKARAQRMATIDSAVAVNTRLEGAIETGERRAATAIREAEERRAAEVLTKGPSFVGAEDRKAQHSRSRDGRRRSMSMSRRGSNASLVRRPSNAGTSHAHSRTTSEIPSSL